MSTDEKPITIIAFGDPERVRYMSLTYDYPGSGYLPFSTSFDNFGKASCVLKSNETHVIFGIGSGNFETNDDADNALQSPYSGDSYYQPGQEGEGSGEAYVPQQYDDNS